MNSDIINTAIRALANFRSELAQIPLSVIVQACKNNPWFSPFYIEEAAHGIASWLDEKNLSEFVARYHQPAESKTLGLITAGNIPFVGFHDLLVGLLSGCKVLVQASRRDRVLTEWLLNRLFESESQLKEQVQLVHSLPSDIQCLIATGSDNAARFFTFNYPHIPKLIRSNRTSVAVLSSETSDEDLTELAKDVFLYNGLGCRNVTHLCVLPGFDMSRLVAWEEYPTEYLNSYYLAKFRREKATLAWLNQPYQTFASVITTPVSDFSPPPMATVRYISIATENELDIWLKQHQERIQCVVGKDVKFGQSQQPKLYNFADNVDTMKFLRNRTLL